MKRLLIPFLLIAAAGAVFWNAGRGAPASDIASAAMSGEMLRLHVVANSNSEFDQSVKYCVRDAVLEESRSLLSSATSAGQAARIADSHKADLLLAARTEAASRGFSGDVTVAVGRFTFPDRTYDGVFVPSGEYDAVRVVLGDGKGENWWCVMYPSLCLPTSTATTAAPPVKFESSIAKWWRSHIK